MDTLAGLCSTFRIEGVPKEFILLKLFHWSLKDKAFEWLQSLSHRCITDWNKRVTLFMKKFSPSDKIMQIKKVRYFSHKRPWPYCSYHTSLGMRPVTKYIRVMPSTTQFYTLPNTRVVILQHLMGTLRAPTRCHSSLGIEPDLAVRRYTEQRRYF